MNIFVGELNIWTSHQKQNWRASSGKKQLNDRQSLRAVNQSSCWLWNVSMRSVDICNGLHESKRITQRNSLDKRLWKKLENQLPSKAIAGSNDPIFTPKTVSVRKKPWWQMSSVGYSWDIGKVTFLPKTSFFGHFGRKTLHAKWYESTQKMEQKSEPRND